MNTKTVKENRDNELKCPDCLISHCKHCKCPLCEENKMPQTLLDDMIADWEHDNLVED